MTNIYTQVINYLSSKDHYQTSDEIRSNRLYINVSVLSTLFALFYIINCAIYNFTLGVIFMTAAVMFQLIELLLFKKNISYRICANLYVAHCVFIAFLPCAFFSGGLFSPVIPWFALVDITALLLLGWRKDTFFWVTINTLIIILFGIGAFMHYDYPKMYNKELTALFFLGSLFGLPLLIFAVASVFEHTSRNALNLLTEFNLKIEFEKKRSDKLLLNILPDSIANRLKLGEQPIADYFEEASIVFVDIVNFTAISSRNDPKVLVEILNNVFTHIDKICNKYNLEKIKTIGDCYMAVSGIPAKIEDHARRSVLFSIDVLNELDNYYTPGNDKIEFRIGLNCGPVVAGVIGEQKFIYDLWGDAVNTASRMESNGVPNNIHCTDNFKNTLETQNYNVSNFIDRGLIDIKGIGKMQTWLLN